MNGVQLDNSARLSHRNMYGMRKRVVAPEALVRKLKRHADSAHKGTPQPATCAACRELSGRPRC